ncbi:membrane protein [Prescottella defluvii]|uniref:membrane protein n=1 Tax=Prescottella defluvii TaxID=1323361 RepID=UPI0004F3A683|nr:membrane protein [Prescottella defluvii]
MSSRYPWLLRIGGSSAVTIWSWILTAPFAVTVMGSYIAARSPRDWPAYFGVAVVVHLLVGAALLLAWLTVLRVNRTRPRPLVSLSVFAVLGACRPLVLDALVGVQGLPTDPRDVGVRIAINVTTAVVALSLIAILVDSVREHQAVMQRLRGARAALDEQRRIDEEYLAGIGRRCAADLADRIDTALSRTDRANIDPERAARLLRAISEDVVRPMSHALFRDVTPLPTRPIAPTPLRRREWLANVLRAVEPAPPVLPAVLYTSVILTFLLTSYGLRTTVLQVASGLVLCVAGNWVVARIVPRVHRTAVRLTVMVTVYVMVAVATALGFYVIIGGTGFPPAFLVPGIAFYPFAAAATSLIRAANVQRAVEERQLATALGEQSRLAAEVHGQVLSARRRLAHVLHSSVQGELVAAALVMHGAATGVPAAGSPAVVDTRVDEIIGRLVREVAREEALPTVPPADARRQITELIGMWSAAVPMQAHIDPAVWPLLSDSPVRLEHAIDVLSEGFTNAIRHGSGGALELTIAVDPRTSLICIGIRSPGRLARDRGDGLGLAALSSRVDAAELVEESGSVLLSVRLG